MSSGPRNEGIIMPQLTDEEKIKAYDEIIGVIGSFSIMSLVEDRSLAFWFHMELYKALQRLNIQFFDTNYPDIAHLNTWELSDWVKEKNVYLKD